MCPQNLMVNFNPQAVVLDVGASNTLIKDVIVTYSISSGDTLISNSSLGTVTIDEPISTNEVCMYKYKPSENHIILSIVFRFIQVKPAKFTLFPAPCPAGYDLVFTGQQQGGLECQCEQNNQLIINCEDDQDSVIVEVNKHFVCSGPALGVNGTTHLTMASLL